MENKQTAVDFFLKEMSDIIGIVNTDAFQNLLMIDAYNKAKQMEKEQIVESHLQGLYSAIKMKGERQSEEYYTEKFGH